jgi:hypothetical protein
VLPEIFETSIAGESPRDANAEKLTCASPRSSALVRFAAMLRRETAQANAAISRSV